MLPPPGMNLRQSPHSFAETVERLTRAITAAGSTIFASIDQAAAAAAVGQSLRPTLLIIFGNPRGGTPVMAAHPLFALHLPLKLLITQLDDGVTVAWSTMADLARAHGIADEPRIATMDRAFESLLGALA